MKSFIVDFKLDSELNSVSQNSPFLTPRCKMQVWATIGQADRPPADQVVKTPAPALFSFSHSTPSVPPTSDLQGLLSTFPTGLPAFKILSSGPNKPWIAASCIGSRPKELLHTAATQAPANLRIWLFFCFVFLLLIHTYQLYLRKGVFLKDPQTGVLHLLKKENIKQKRSYNWL